MLAVHEIACRAVPVEGIATEATNRMITSRYGFTSRIHIPSSASGELLSAISAHRLHLSDHYFAVITLRAIVYSLTFTASDRMQMLPLLADPLQMSRRE